jgi:hypothetical protein
MVEKGNLQDISCKMRDAGFDVSFRDCPAKGGTGGHPNWIASTFNNLEVFLHEYIRIHVIPTS